MPADDLIYNRSEAKESTPMNDATEPRPAQPLRPRVKIDQWGESLRLSYRRREWGVGCFLIFWLIGWTVGCVFLAGLVIREPEPVHFLFAVPFWASWFFVFALLLKMFCQREEFSLGPAGATFSRRVFAEIKCRETPLREIKRFGIFERVVDSETGRTESGIEMETLGLSLEFAAGLAQPELLWLQDLLQRQLADLCESLHIEPPADDSASQSDDRIDSDPSDSPSDCSWHREDDFDTVTFRQSGRLSLPAAGFLLFINLFWNGILSVFLCLLCGVMDDAPQGAEWWGLFFFLIPFEAIGFAMLTGLLLVVLEPMRRTSWQIGRSNITCRLTWFGIGPSWYYTIERLDRIQVENKEAKKQHRVNQVTVPWKSSGATFRLSFVDKSNREVCSIDGLTEGESQWMANIIRQERLIWFR
jgi:hypothetical protein